MDWKARLVSSIEAAVEAAVETAVNRAVQTAVKETRAYTDGSRQRIGEKIKERRHARAVGIHNVVATASDMPAATTSEASFNCGATLQLGKEPGVAASNSMDLAATLPRRCSTQCLSHAVTVPVSTTASAVTTAPSNLTASVDPERYCFGLELMTTTSTPTSTLDVSGACSTAANSLTHGAISTTIIPAPEATAVMAMDISMPTPASASGDINFPASPTSGTYDVCIVLPASKVLGVDPITSGEDPVDMFRASGSAALILSQEDSPALLYEPLTVFERDMLPPTTCSTECSRSNLDAPSLAFSITHITATRLLPAAASFLDLELMVQAWMSPTACSSVSVREDDINSNNTYTMEVPMTKDDMFLTNPVVPAVSHVHPLKFPDGCLHGNKTQLLIGSFVASTDSPWDPGQQASMSLLGVGVTKISSNDTVKDNQKPFFRWEIAWLFYLEYPDIGIDKVKPQLCPASRESFGLNPLESTQASTHVFCPSRKKVVQLVRRQLSIPESDASILLLEGLPLFSIHLTVGSSGAGSACLCNGIITIAFWTHFKPGMLTPLHYKDLSFWRYISVDQMMQKTGHVIQSGLEHIQWKIAWSLNLKNLNVVNQSEQTILAATYPKLYFPWHPGDDLVQHILLLEVSCLNCKRLIVDAATQYDFECFAWEFAWSLHSVCCAGMANTVPFQFSVSIAMRSFRSLEFCQGKLSWDPGIGALLYFFGFYAQTEVTGRRNLIAPAFYSDSVCVDRPYYLDAFSDQVNISDEYFLEQVGVVCSLNLAKFRLNYGTHYDLGEVLKHQAPWDLGGSTWHRLEVKPNFKEGGMLATNRTLFTGWAIGCAYWAWADGKQQKATTTYTSERATNDSAWIRTASASSASVSSSSRVPLLLCTS
ncbi:hypothetical protein CFC21_092810 [Triticum aestivum]|uniref:Aminotransferase-like plant mobile domain-containing protein n=2 Tax=Triticum aestivum TaxID=4565 RepID=A0A9R1MUK4_WHEAT|nr:hypothetical protein CFC21_092810 [Triticum aestivum]